MTIYNDPQVDNLKNSRIEGTLEKPPLKNSLTISSICNEMMLNVYKDLSKKYKEDGFTICVQVFDQMVQNLESSKQAPKESSIKPEGTITLNPNIQIIGKETLKIDESTKIVSSDVLAHLEKIQEKVKGLRSEFEKSNFLEKDFNELKDQFLNFRPSVEEAIKQAKEIKDRATPQLSLDSFLCPVETRIIKGCQSTWNQIQSDLIILENKLFLTKIKEFYSTTFKEQIGNVQNRGEILKKLNDKLKEVAKKESEVPYEKLKEEKGPHNLLLRDSKFQSPSFLEENMTSEAELEVKNVLGKLYEELIDQVREMRDANQPGPLDSDVMSLLQSAYKCPNHLHVEIYFDILFNQLQILRLQAKENAEKVFLFHIKSDKKAYCDRLATTHGFFPQHKREGVLDKFVRRIYETDYDNRVALYNELKQLILEQHKEISKIEKELATAVVEMLKNSMSALKKQCKTLLKKIDEQKGSSKEELDPIHDTHSHLHKKFTRLEEAKESLSNSLSGFSKPSEDNQMILGDLITPSETDRYSSLIELITAGFLKLEKKYNEATQAFSGKLGIPLTQEGLVTQSGIWT